LGARHVIEWSAWKAVIVLALGAAISYRSFEMNAPIWVERIIKEVARSARRSRPDLRWRQTRRRRSSGCATDELDTNRDTIAIVAGRDAIDQRLVLCHELAHWLIGPEKGHSISFWNKAWRLYRRYRVPIHYALAREGEYVGAILAYEKSRKRSS
jgi:hypothetical protein